MYNKLKNPIATVFFDVLTFNRHLTDKGNWKKVKIKIYFQTVYEGLFYFKNCQTIFPCSAEMLTRPGCMNRCATITVPSSGSSQGVGTHSHQRWCEET